MITTSKYCIFIIFQIGSVLSSSNIEPLQEIDVWLYQQLYQISGVEIVIELFISNSVTSCFDSCDYKTFLRFKTLAYQIRKTKSADTFDLRADNLLVVEIRFT